MSVKVDVFATQPHYRRHLLPIFRALPPEMQGTVHPLGEMTTLPGRVGLVAGGVDAHVLRNQCKVFYVEHGAGQSYAGADLAAAQMPGYSAADGHRWPHVLGFICPNERVARNWTTAPSVAVGCPKMDEHILDESWTPQGTVCFAWHWDATFCPEARSAWLHYSSSLIVATQRFRSQGYEVFGHSHPRWGDQINNRMAASGMTILPTDEDVFYHAEILLVDNSSIGPEFNSLGRPIIWLNAPWYRREVHHGQRFWEWTEMAPTIDDRNELLDLDLDSIVRKKPGQVGWVAADAYEHIDGKASERAAAFIVDILRGV